MDKVRITRHEIAWLSKGAIEDKADLKLLEHMPDGFYVLFFAGVELFSVVGPFRTRTKYLRFLAKANPHDRYPLPASAPDSVAASRALAETNM